MSDASATSLRFDNAASLRSYTIPNCMNKTVQWFQNDRVSLYRKVGAIALAIIATLAVGHLAGHTAIVFTAVALSAGIWANVESGKIEKAQAAEKVARAEARRVSFEQMQEAFRGKEAWEKIPLATDRNKVDYPIMRGVDRATGRPFVLMKWFRQDTKAQTLAAIKQDEMGNWQLRLNNAHFFGGGINPFKAHFDREDWDALRQIVEGSHRLYALVKEDSRNS